MEIPETSSGVRATCFFKNVEKGGQTTASGLCPDVRTFR